MTDQLAESKAAFQGEALAGRLGVLAQARSAAESAHRLWPAALAGAVGAVLFVHLPVLDHYFFGDDFVALADITSRSTWGYLRDLFLVRDLTPNWRFLAGLFYLGAYRAFGLNAFPYFLANVAVHLGTVALIFWLVRRATGAVWPAFLAAAFFGLTPAHVPTVGQVTAFNNVLAGFLFMLALVTLYEGLVRQQPGWWGAAAALSFAGAIAANESIAMAAPVLALVVLWKFSETDEWWREPRQWLRAVKLAAPYLLIGGVALTVLGACRCTEAAKAYDAGTPPFIANFWAYLGRLLYPVPSMDLPGFVGTTHLASAGVVVLLSFLALFRGPQLARISIVFLFLSLVPYLMVTFALAPRYVYVAAIPFSILAALLFAEAARYGHRLMPVLPALLAIVAFGVLGLYGWQSWEQNQVFASLSERWRTLVTGLDERFPDLPEGSRVYVRGGPITEPLWQFYVLPSVGEVLWGGVALNTAPEGTQELCTLFAGELRVLDYDGGQFTQVTVLDLPAPPSLPASWWEVTECPRTTFVP